MHRTRTLILNRFPLLLMMLFTQAFMTTAHAFRLEGEDFDDSSVDPTTDNDANVTMRDGEWILFKDVDFTGASSVEILAARGDGSGVVRARLGSPTGTSLGTTTFSTGGWRTFVTQTISTGSTTGVHDLYIQSGSPDRAVVRNIKVGASLDKRAVLFDDLAESLKNRDFYFVSLQKAWARYDNVDLSGVTSLTASVANGTTGKIEFRLGSPTGTKIAEISTSGSGSEWRVFKNYNANVTGSHGVVNLYLVGTGDHGGVVDYVDFHGGTSGGNAVRFTGDNTYGADNQHDGGYRHIVGVHEHALARPTNNTAAAAGPLIGHAVTQTRFNHHPFLTYWQGKFWAYYIGFQFNESTKTGFLHWSDDGRTWNQSDLAVMFPAPLATHQRMAFYEASNGRLLVSTWYSASGEHARQQAGSRLIREIKGPNDFGPIHILKHNQAGPASGLDAYSLYTASSDNAFKAACDELLNNKLYMQQMWEEDGDTGASSPYVYRDLPDSSLKGQAFQWVRLENGRLITHWKGAYMGITSGSEWTSDQISLDHDVPRFGQHRNAKMWNEPISSGGYAMFMSRGIQNLPGTPPSWGWDSRTPLVVARSSDGFTYATDLFTISGDSGKQLYRNGTVDNKTLGPSYVRGIQWLANRENKTRPNDNLWITYSTNKEFIWVTEVPKELATTVSSHVNDQFATWTPGARVGLWNIRDGAWTPVQLVSNGSATVLRMQDKDPYDFAKAFRVFPESTQVTVTTTVTPLQSNTGELHVELVDKTGKRPVRLRFNSAGNIQSQNPDGTWSNRSTYVANQPVTLTLQVNTGNSTWTVFKADTAIGTNLPFAEAAASVERVEYRSGSSLLKDFSTNFYGGGTPGDRTSDLPGAHDPVSLARFDVHGLQTVAGLVDPDGAAPPPPPDHDELTIASVTASTLPGDAAKTIDGDPATSWSHGTLNASITFTLATASTLGSVDVLMDTRTDGRTYQLDLLTSDDGGATYTTQASNVSISTDGVFNSIVLSPALAGVTHVRLINKGNNSNNWIHLHEVAFFGANGDGMVIIDATADSFTLQGSGDTNYGSNTTLLVKASTPGVTRRIFLKFPVADLASATQVNLALRVVSLGTEGPSGHSFTLHEVADDAWTEAEITWNTQPSVGTAILSRTVTSAEVGTDILLDVTDYVKAQAAGDGMVTLALVQPANTNRMVTFSSKEGEVAPRLIAIPPSGFRLEAESYDAASGDISAEPDEPHLISLQQNQWARYDNLDLTDITELTANIATGTTGKIEFRIGGSAGTLIAEITTSGTGDQWRTFKDYTAAISGTHGIVDLFLVGKPAFGGVVDYIDFSGHPASDGVAPTNILLTGSAVSEGQPAGTVVGFLNAFDQSELHTHTFQLVNGDTHAFQIDGNRLTTAQNFDHATQSSYSVTVRATNALGQTFDKVFSIQVAQAGSATDYYVATTGSDSNPGTLAQPFRTIQKAATLAQSGATVYVRAGTYRETVHPANTGIPGRPITFQPHNGETVILSGADPVTGTWTQHSGNIYRKTLDTPALPRGRNQLIINGENAPIARFPNSDDIMFPNQFTGDLSIINPDNEIRLASPANLTGPADRFVGATLNIKLPAGIRTTAQVTADPGTGTLTLDPDMHMPGYAAGEDIGFFLQDNLALLDAPGEWFLDRATNELYLMMPDGSDPSTGNVEIKRRTYAFDLTGRSHIVIKGFDLFATSISTNTAFDMGDPETWTFATSDITIDDIRAKYLSYFDISEQNIPGQDIWIPSAFQHGIFLHGYNHRVSNSVLHKSWGSFIVCLGFDNVITNNWIHDGNYLGIGMQSGISMGRGPVSPDGAGRESASVRYPYTGGRNEVSHNTIHQLGRDAVGFNGNRGGRIVHNHMFDCMLNTDDGGILYAWREDMEAMEIAYNYLHDNGPDRYWDAAVYLDGAFNVRVHHNVIYNAGWGIQTNMKWGGKRWIYNNTVDSSPHALYFNHYDSFPNDWDDTHVINNLFVTAVESTVHSRYSQNATRYTNNLFSGTNPKLVDRAGRDYRLQSDSPAIDAGLEASPDTDGFTGAAPDIGALEFGKPHWPYGSSLVDSANDAPTDISLSDSNVEENQPSGTVVGLLSTTDPDAGDTHSYTLVGGDTAAFSVVGNELRTAVVFDFETQSSYTVTIRSTDQDGLIFDKVFTITVTDADESGSMVPFTHRLEAETYAAASGDISAEADEPHLISLQNNWARYDNVDLTDVTRLTAHVAVGVTGTLTFRIGSTIGTILATLNTSGTGSEWRTFKNYNADLVGTHGVVTLFIVGSGDHGGVIDWIDFSGERVATPYEVWSADMDWGDTPEALRAPEADANGNGYSNFMERALGGDPTAENAKPEHPVHIVPHPENGVRFTQWYHKNASELTYRFAWSTDLVEWHHDDVHAEAYDADSGMHYQIWTAPEVMTKAFGRLEISQP
ncbi:MAG: carbohydrate-binding protein [Opitutales bacterium]